MNGRMRSWLVGTGIGLGILLLVPQTVRADWSWRRSDWRHHGESRPYETIVVLPVGASPIIVGDSTYYYCRGIYYRYGPRGYVVVPAPLGAVVPVLPQEHRTIVIDGVTYHEYGGVYYKGGPTGYTVVPIYQGNTASATPTPLAVPSANDANRTSTLVVNVPNRNGSYTPVTLQLATNGMYIGPQGEVYPNVPAVNQLQAMYGK